jgi:hypothetical protein
MPSTKTFGFKNRNFGGFSLGQEVPKTFCIALAKAAA